MLGAYNVTDTPRSVPEVLLTELGLSPDDVVDRITGEPPIRQGSNLVLPPYGVLWLT